jgi:hypothetical protein
MQRRRSEKGRKIKRERVLRKPKEQDPVKTRYIRIDWIDAPSQWLYLQWLCSGRPTQQDKKLSNFTLGVTDNLKEATIFKVHHMLKVYKKLKPMLPETANVVAIPTQGVRITLESFEQKEARRWAYEQKLLQQQQARARKIARGFGSNTTVDLGSNSDLQNMSNKVDCGHCGICRDCLERLGKL